MPQSSVPDAARLDQAGAGGFLPEPRTYHTVSAKSASAVATSGADYRDSVRGMEAAELREAIRRSLLQQGFTLGANSVIPPRLEDKAALRRLHALAVEHSTERARPGLERHEPELLRRFAFGAEIEPDSIRPRLVEVRRKSADELLFRYARLHWSIPVSSGYGRRLRFLVIDEQNEKLIGLIGLGDPVFALKARDEWVGWDRETRRARLTHVMDAFVLGAVPPYSFLLGGKLVAMLAASTEVRTAFKRKYGKGESLISGDQFDGRLALVTTTSALGRSSVYNRLVYQAKRNEPLTRKTLYHSVGYTRGSGEFHFSNGLYGAMTQYALENCAPTAKSPKWGTGFRNRREVVKKSLQHLGLSDQWLYHGIRREIFVIPLADNASAFLRGEHQRLRPLKLTAETLATYWSWRWCAARSTTNDRWRSWDPNYWRLWTHERIDH
jgi:hypothetical protein